MVIMPYTSRMKKSVSYPGTAVIALVVLAALVFLPVSGMVYQPAQVSLSAANSRVPVSTNVTATVSATQFVSATISSGSPVVGDPVTISGTVTASTLPPDVRIWVFAGNYVNVSNVLVNAGGGFSKTYSTTGLPPAKYYVFVQSPGANEEYDINLEESGIYSGQVVNTLTNASIFNFTGTGSLRNANALQALSEAINDQGVDDAYTKLTFLLTAPGMPITGQTSAGTQETSGTPVAATTAKSPLTPPITILALVGGWGAAMYLRKRS